MYVLSFRSFFFSSIHPSTHAPPKKARVVSQPSTPQVVSSHPPRVVAHVDLHSPIHPSTHTPTPTHTPPQNPNSSTHHYMILHTARGCARRPRPRRPPPAWGAGRSGSPPSPPSCATARSGGCCGCFVVLLRKTRIPPPLTTNTRTPQNHQHTARTIPPTHTHARTHARTSSKNCRSESEKGRTALVRKMTTSARGTMRCASWECLLLQARQPARQGE